MSEQIINRTKKWINTFVIGYNLCPFARKVQLQNRIEYIVNESSDLSLLMTAFLENVQLLSRIPAEKIDTSLFIVPNALEDFEEYLDFVATAEDLVIELGFEGIFQIATFHPKYQFAGTKIDDIENYTNRSPFPMLHILREESLTKALENYEQPELIPQRNIATMKQLGVEYLNNRVIE